MTERATKSHATEDRPLARRIGARLRRERQRAGLTQAQVAEGRYTKAYISALENGLVKPSMAALNFIAERLGVPLTRLLTDDDRAWRRLEADVHLAGGDWQIARGAYQALLGDATSDRVERAELLRGLAEALCRLDRGREAIAPAAEAGALFREVGRPDDAAIAGYWEAFGHYHAENSDEARALLSDLLRQAREGLRVEPDFPVRLLVALAMVESRDDRPERALAYLEEARSAVTELDDRRRATFLFSLAIGYRELGDLEAALSTAGQSLALFRAAEAEFEVASIENELALVFVDLGNAERARAHAAQARSRFEALADTRWLAHVLDTEAQIELAAGAPVRAKELAQQALDLARGSQNRKASISALLSLARAERALGSFSRAAEALEEAAGFAREFTRRAQLEEVLVEWSEVAAELDDLGLAYELSREALGVRHRRSAPRPEVADRPVPAARPRGSTG